MALAMPKRTLRMALFTPRTYIPQTSIRWATNTAKSPLKVKPVPARVLEQPDKFRPPSHAAHRIKPITYTGPPLSDKEVMTMMRKHYPHMMPPEGSMLHWFLHSYALHMTLTVGILAYLCLYLVYDEMMRETPYADQLPPNSLFFSHPTEFLWQYWLVYAATVAHSSERVGIKREMKADDTRKRKEFLRAHGMDDQSVNWFDFWGLRDVEAEKKEQAAMPGGPNYVPPNSVAASAAATATAAANEEQNPGVEQSGGGPEKKKVKKWLGIW